jgi:uncharacterized membrane protein
MKPAKYALFALIALMMGVVIYRDRALLDASHPIWRHYEPFKWWLLPHGIPGALALFLGPLQFSTRLRRLHLHWHQLIGRTYVCGVAVAAPIGIVIEAINYVHGASPLRLLIASTGLGVLFALTTGIGFVLVRRGRIAQHQRWMIRSYAVAIVFLQTRCVEQIHWLSRLLQAPLQFLETHHISDMWLHIAVSLIAAELIVRQRRRVTPSRGAAMAARPVSTAS